MPGVGCGGAGRGEGPISALRPGPGEAERGEGAIYHPGKGKGRDLHLTSSSNRLLRVRLFVLEAECVAVYHLSTRGWLGVGLGSDGCPVVCSGL